MDRESFISIIIRGTELRYRRSGSGEPLILLHANISDARSFTRIEPMLSQYFDVITFCRRHHWPNEPLADGQDDQWEEHAEDIVSLIEKLNLGSTHILGNSNSGLIALIVARNHPELVKSLTLEEPVGITIFLPRLPPGVTDLLYLLWHFPRLFLPLVMFGATVMPKCEAAFQKGDNEGGLQIFSHAVIGDRQMSAMSSERIEQMRANIKPHAAIWTGKGMPKFTAEDLRGIKPPVLFLTGEYTATTHIWMDYYMASMVSEAKAVQIKGAGHLVHEDMPDEVVATMLRFVST